MNDLFILRARHVLFNYLFYFIIIIIISAVNQLIAKYVCVLCIFILYI